MSEQVVYDTQVKFIEEAEQMLSSYWRRVVEDPSTRTLSYVANNRPRELAAEFLPLARYAQELERELHHANALLEGIGVWMTNAIDYVAPTRDAVNEQIATNQAILNRKDEQEDSES